MVKRKHYLTDSMRSTLIHVFTSYLKMKEEELMHDELECIKRLGIEVEVYEKMHGKEA